MNNWGFPFGVLKGETTTTPSSTSGTSASSSSVSSSASSGVAASGGATATVHMLEAYEREVFYELELLDTIETGGYKVILSNETYYDSNDLEPGINHGEFFDLEPETEYTFEVEEGGDIEEKE